MKNLVLKAPTNERLNLVVSLASLSIFERIRYEVFYMYEKIQL